jgi:aspartokinase/homoserine dehydrogenase 1
MLMLPPEWTPGPVGDNIVIAWNGRREALRAVHSAFYLSSQTLSIGLIGTGLIGGTFLNQLNRRLDPLREGRGIDLRVRGIANSRKMRLDDRRLELQDWKAELDQSTVAVDIERFVEHIRAAHLPHAVIIDATASDALPQYYEGWLARGINIITPNKKGNAGPVAA